MTKVYYDKWVGGVKVSDGMTEMGKDETLLSMGYTKCKCGAHYTGKNCLFCSDWSTADYYKLPKLATELQDLISEKNMNAQIGEIFRECYRYGQASHSDELRGIKKILFYANAELKRLTK